MTPEQALLAVILIEQAVIFHLLRQLPKLVADEVRGHSNGFPPHEGG